MAVTIKSAREIELMRESCRRLEIVHDALGAFIKPGISTMDINRYGEQLIREQDGIPNFLNYNGFPASICVSVNEEVVHGIPSKKRILREGDIVSVDLGTIYKDYYSDAARTYPVGKISEENARLIRVAEESFFEGLKFCREGYRLGDVSHAIQAHVEANGFSVVRDFVGHGGGHDLHEDPPVPNYGKSHHGPRLVPGMTLAIEPMITVGDYDVEVLSNDWTAVTVDGSFAAHYENTVVITDGEPRILTLEPKGGI